MGRPSKLHESQWREIQVRLLAGERAADLAREFGTSKTALSVRFSGRSEIVRTVANQLVAAEVSLRTLPVSEQVAALNLAEELRSISVNLAGAARYGAATAHRLAGIANVKAAEIDAAAPLTDVSLTTLRGIAALTRIANDAAATGLTLLSSNKEAVGRAAAADVPHDLGYFYGEGAADPA
jgi:hypothetical protein